MAKSNILGSVLSTAILFIIIYLVYNYCIRTPHTTLFLNISAAEARARRFGLIIDARTLSERELLGYYPNSIILNRLEEQNPLDIPKNTWILVYSNGYSDHRARITSEILYKKGYKNVRHISETYLSLMPK